MAQCSIQSWLRGISGPKGHPTSFDLGRTRGSGPMFQGKCVRNFQPRKNHNRKANAQVSLNLRVSMELLPKPVMPSRHALPLLVKVLTKTKTERTAGKNQVCLKQKRKAKKEEGLKNTKNLSPNTLLTVKKNGCRIANTAIMKRGDCRPKF